MHVCVSDVLWLYIVFIVYRHPKKRRKKAKFCSITILVTKQKGKESRKKGRKKNKQGSLKLLFRLIVE